MRSGTYLEQPFPRARGRERRRTRGVGGGVYGCVWGRTRVEVVVCGGVVCVARVRSGVVGRGGWARRARRAIGRLTRLRFFIRAGEQEQGDSMRASIGDGAARRRDGAEGTAQKKGESEEDKIEDMSSGSRGLFTTVDPGGAPRSCRRRMDARWSR